jgi:hypothetical protein
MSCEVAASLSSAVPARIALLSGRRRLPHWPIGPWHAAVAGVLRHVDPYEQLESYCVALNNAALIELTLGRAADAHALCQLQTRLLADAPGALRDSARLYIWQPIINLARLELRTDVQVGLHLLRALSDVACGGRCAGLPDYLEQSLSHAGRAREMPRIRTWLREVVFTETVQAAFRLGRPQLLADALAYEARADGEPPLMAALACEARFVAGLWQGKAPRPEALADEAVPFVVGLAQVARWRMPPSGAECAWLRPLLVLALEQLLDLDGTEDFNNELLGHVAWALAGMALSESGLDASERRLLTLGAARFRRLQDEVWEARQLRALPDEAPRLQRLRARSRYREVTGGGSAPLRPLPSLARLADRTASHVERNGTA